MSVNHILTLADVTCSPWFLKSMHCFSLRILFESTSRLVHRGTESSGKNAVDGEMLRRKSRLGGFRPYFRTGSELRSLSPSSTLALTLSHPRARLARRPRLISTFPLRIRRRGRRQSISERASLVEAERMHDVGNRSPFVKAPHFSEALLSRAAASLALLAVPRRMGYSYVFRS